VIASSSACRTIALALLLVACDKRPPVVTVARVLLSLPPRYDGEGADRERLRAELASRLADTPRVTYRPNARDAAYMLTVSSDELVELPGESGEVRPVRVVLQPLAGGPEFRAVGMGLPLVEIVASTLTGFDDAWKVIAEERRLSIAEDAMLVAVLRHPDRRLREFGIETLADRKSRVAVEPLAALLESEPEPELILRAVGALVAIGDPRAAEPLIALARNKSPEVVVQVAYALGALGGTVAEGYLVTLASGHPVEEVRAAATQALKDLSARPTTAKPDLTPSRR